MSSETKYLLDVNVLVALAWQQHVHHARARRWFTTVSQWCTTPTTESGLVRLSMNASVVGRVVTMSESVAMLAAIRSAPGFVFVPDTTSLADPSVTLTRVATSRQVTDAHLVNIAAQSESVLATLDRAIPSMLEPADRRHVFVLPA
jgi:toxin-antitoxin system PIN domain toxin